MRLIRAWNAGNRLRSVIAIATLIAAPAVAQSQQATITGKVTAAGSGQPLVEARVQVVGQSIVTSVNAEGRYTLRGVPAGTMEVRVIRVGLIPYR